ncbi:hypothetical protein GCM10027447_31910 [Glycomyces halotolerans]
MPPSDGRGESPSAFNDPEGYMRQFEERMAAIRGKAEQTQQLMAETSVRVESEDREVAVTVNVGGALTDIEFSPAAKHLSGQGLAALVMETYREAAAEASRRSVEVMSGLLGDDSEAMSVIRQTVNRYAPED